MNKIKKFFKEIKRIKWPSVLQSGNSFVANVVFIIIFSLVFFGLAMLLAILWQGVGIGV